MYIYIGGQYCACTCTRGASQTKHSRAFCVYRQRASWDSRPRGRWACARTLHYPLGGGTIQVFVYIRISVCAMTHACVRELCTPHLGGHVICACCMTNSCVRHDSFMCARTLHRTLGRCRYVSICVCVYLYVSMCVCLFVCVHLHVCYDFYVCAMTHSYACHDSLVVVNRYRYVYIRTCAMPFVCLPWLIRVRAMTHPCGSWRTKWSATPCKQLVRACAMTRSWVGHDSFVCVPWVIHVCAMTHSCICHDFHSKKNEVTVLCVHWLIHVCHDSCVYNHSFMCVMTHTIWSAAPQKQLVRVCAKTHSCVCHDSFVCVMTHPWLIHVCV